MLVLGDGLPVGGLDVVGEGDPGHALAAYGALEHRAQGHGELKVLANCKMIKQVQKARG